MHSSSCRRTHQCTRTGTYARSHARVLVHTHTVNMHAVYVCAATVGTKQPEVSTENAELRKALEHSEARSRELLARKLEEDFKEKERYQLREHLGRTRLEIDSKQHDQPHTTIEARHATERARVLHQCMCDCFVCAGLTRMSARGCMRVCMCTRRLLVCRYRNPTWIDGHIVRMAIHGWPYCIDGHIAGIEILLA